MTLLLRLLVRHVVGKRSGLRSMRSRKGHHSSKEKSSRTAQCHCWEASNNSATPRSRSRMEVSSNVMDCDAPTRKAGPIVSLRRADVNACPGVAGAMSAAADVVAACKNVSAAAADASKYLDGKRPPSHAECPTVGRAHEHLTDDAGIAAAATRAPAQFCAPQRDYADAAAITHPFLQDSKGAPATVAAGRESLVRPAGIVFCIALGTWGDVFPLFCAAVRTLELVVLRAPGRAAGAGVFSCPAERRNAVTPCHLEIFFTTHACWVHTLLLWIRGGSTLAASRAKFFEADGKQSGARGNGSLEPDELLTSGNSEKVSFIGGKPKRPAGKAKGKSDSEVKEGAEEDRERKEERHEEAQGNRKVTKRLLKGGKEEERWNAWEGERHRERARRTTVKCRHMRCRTHEQSDGGFAFFHASGASSQRTASPPSSHFFHIGVLSAQQAHARLQYLQQSDASRCPADGTPDELRKPAAALGFRHSVEGASTPYELAAAGSRKADPSMSPVSSVALSTAEIFVAFGTRASSAIPVSSSGVAPSNACVQCSPPVLAAESLAAPPTGLAALTQGESAPAFRPAAPSLSAASASVFANYSPVDARLHSPEFRDPPLPTVTAVSTPLTACTPPAVPRRPAASRSLTGPLPSGAPSTLAESETAPRCCLWLVSLPSSPLLHSARGGPCHAASSLPCRAEEIQPLMRLLVESTQQRKKSTTRDCSERRGGEGFDRHKQTRHKSTDSAGRAQQLGGKADAFLRIRSEGKGRELGNLGSRTSDGRSAECSRCRNISIASTSGSYHITESCIKKLSNKGEFRAPHGASSPVGERPIWLHSTTDTNYPQCKVEWISGWRSSGTSSSRSSHSRITDFSAPHGGSGARIAAVDCDACVYTSGCRISGRAIGKVPSADGTACSRTASKQLDNMSEADGSTRKRRRITRSMTGRRREMPRVTFSKNKRLLPVENEDNKYGPGGGREKDSGAGDAEQEGIESEAQVSAHCPTACVCVCNPFSAVWLHAAEAVGMARLLLVPSPALALRDPPPGLMEALLSRYPQLQGRRSTSCKRVHNLERLSISRPQDVRVGERQRRARRKVCVGDEQQPPPQVCFFEACYPESVISRQRQRRIRALEREQPQQKQSSSCRRHQHHQQQPIQEQQKQDCAQCGRQHIPHHAKKRRLYGGQCEGERYRITAENCSSKSLLSNSSCTKSKISSSAGCRELKVSCTQASSSTQQPANQLHLPRRLVAEGGNMENTNSRRVSTANSVWNRSLAGTTGDWGSSCCAAATGADGTGTEYEVGTDLTPEAVVAVAHWAVQAASRPLRLQDLGHWQWRLCLDDHDAFRKRVLRIGPLLSSSGARATTAVNDATAAARNMATAPAGNATTAPATGIEGSLGDALATPASVAAPAAAGDGAAAAGSGAAIGTPTGGAATVCKGVEKKGEPNGKAAPGAVATEGGTTSDYNVCLFETSDTGAGAPSCLTSRGDMPVCCTRKATCILHSAVSAICRTGSRARSASSAGTSSNSRWAAHGSKMSKARMRSINSSSVCSRRSHWWPTVGSRNWSVLRTVSSACMPRLPWAPVQKDAEASKRTSPRTSEQPRASRGRGTTHPRAIPVIHFLDTDFFPEAVARLPASAMIARPPQAPWKALEMLLNTATTPPEAQEPIQSPLCVASRDRNKAKGENTQKAKGQEMHRSHNCENPAGPAESTELSQRQQQQQQPQESERQKKQRRGKAQRLSASDTCFFTHDQIARRTVRHASARCPYFHGTVEGQIRNPAVGLSKQPTAVPRLRVSFFGDSGLPCFPIFSQYKSRWKATTGGSSLNMRQSRNQPHQYWGNHVAETFSHASSANSERGGLHPQREVLMSHAELLTVLREAGAAHIPRDVSEEAVEMSAAMPGGKLMVRIEPQEVQQPEYAGAAAVDYAYDSTWTHEFIGESGVQAAAGDRRVEAVARAEDLEGGVGLDKSPSTQQSRATRMAAHHAVPSRVWTEKRKGLISTASIPAEHTPESSVEAAEAVSGTLMRVAGRESLRLTACEECHSSETGGSGHGALTEGNFLAVMDTHRRKDRPIGKMKIRESPGWLIYVAFGSMHARELGLLPSVPCLARILAQVGVRLNKRVLLHVPFSSFEASTWMDQRVAETAASSSPEERGILRCLTDLRRCANQEDNAAAVSPSWRVLVLHSLVDLPLLLKELTRHSDERECIAKAANPQFPEKASRTPESVCMPVRPAVANRGAAVLNAGMFKAAGSVSESPLSELAYKETEILHIPSTRRSEPCADPPGDVATGEAQREGESRDVSGKAHGEGPETGPVDAAGDITKHFEKDVVDAPGEAAEHVPGEDAISNAIVAGLHAVKKANQCKEEACRKRAIRRHTEGRKEVGSACESCRTGARPRTRHIEDRAWSLASAGVNVSARSRRISQDTWVQPFEETATASGLPRSRFLKSSMGNAGLRDGSRGVSSDETAQPGGSDDSARTTTGANYCGGARTASGVSYVDRERRISFVSGDTVTKIENVCEGATVERDVLWGGQVAKALPNPGGNRDLFCVLTHASAGAAATLTPLVRKSSPAHDGCCYWKQILKKNGHDCIRAPSHTALTSCCTSATLSSTGAHCVKEALQQQENQHPQVTRDSMTVELSCTRNATAATTALESREPPPTKARASAPCSQCPLSLLSNAQQGLGAKWRPPSKRAFREGLGIPWLVFPFFFDQPMIATRLAARHLATVASDSLLDCLEEVAAIEKELAAQRGAQHAVEASLLALRENIFLGCAPSQASHAGTPHSRSTLALSRRQERVHEGASASQLPRTHGEHQLRKTFKPTTEDAGSTRFQPHTPHEDGRRSQLRSDRERNENRETSSDVVAAYKAAASRCEKPGGQRGTTKGEERCALKLGLIYRATQGPVSSAVISKAEDTSGANECPLPSYTYGKGSYPAPQKLGDLFSAKEAEGSNQAERADRELSKKSSWLLENKLTRLQQRLVRLLLEEIRAGVWQKVCGGTAEEEKEQRFTETAASWGHSEAATAEETDRRCCISAVDVKNTRRSVSSACTQRAETYVTRTSLVRTAEKASRSESKGEAQATDVDDFLASVDAQGHAVRVGEPAGLIVQEDGARVAAWAILALLQQQLRRQ